MGCGDKQIDVGNPILIEYLVAECSLSVRRSYEAVGLSRAIWYRQPQDRLERDSEMITALTKVTDEHRRWGGLEVLPEASP